MGRHIAIPAALPVFINDATHIGLVRHARLVPFQKQLPKGPSTRLCSQRRSSRSQADRARPQQAESGESGRKERDQLGGVMQNPVFMP